MQQSPTIVNDKLALSSYILFFVGSLLLIILGVRVLQTDEAKETDGCEKMKCMIQEMESNLQRMKTRL